MAGARDVVRFEVVRSLKKKTFWYASVTVPVIILAIVGISYFSSTSAKKNSEQQAAAYAKTAKIGVLDESGLVSKRILKAQHITLEPSRAAGVAAVKANRLDAFFYYPRDLVRHGVSIYAKDQGVSFAPPYNAAAVQLLSQSIALTVSHSLGNPQAVQILQRPLAVSDVTYKNGAQSNGLAGIIAPGIFLIVFMALIILLSYLMIASTTEEKENRTAEMLLTCVRSRVLILGKIAAIAVLGIVQIAVIAVPLIIFYRLFPNSITLPGNVTLSQVPLDPAAITIAAAFLIAGFIFYTSFIVGVGALFPNANEAGRFLGLIMIWVYVPLYALSLVVSSPHALIVTFFTYFPLTAPTTVLLRNAVGTISLGETATALAIVLAGTALAIPFAVRSFRYGAMQYGRRLSFKEVWSQSR